MNPWSGAAIGGLTFTPNWGDRAGMRRSKHHCNALTILFQADGDLLIRDAAERTIAQRLARYLEDEFPGFHVNVEYNRHGFDKKRLDLPDDCGGAKRRVYPDVVVHRRGHDKANLLVVELKKSTNPESRDCDRAKLTAMKAQLHYAFAVFVEIPAGPGAHKRKPVQEWQ